MFLPLGGALFNNVSYEATVFGMKTLASPPETVYSSLPLAGLTLLIALIAFITIFLYKNRKRQILLSNINSFLIVLFYALLAYYLSSFKEQAEEMPFQMKIAIAFPLIDLVLYYLAVRKIKADEALIRSLNRLR